MSKIHLPSHLIREENGEYYIKICKGCKTYEDDMKLLPDSQKKDYIYLCNVSVAFKEGVECPCSMCIIKMVCEKRCEVLSNYLLNHPIMKGPKKQKED